MLISATLAPLVLAASSTTQLEDARTGLIRCLITVHNTSVDEQITIPAFNEKIETACEAERTKYHALVVTAERGYGANSAEAKQYADEELTDMIDGFKYDFSINRDEKAKLSID